MSSTSKQGNSNERMKHLLSSGEDADVHFLFLLHAHKLILKSASDVFEAMFRFDSKNGKAENASADNPVEVPDVEAAAFKVMLSFIYADDLSELDGENAMAVLYAAKKYGVAQLVSPCLQIPIPKLSNVFLAFAQARLFDLEDFAHQCLRFICQNACQLFESVEFLQIDQKLLCELFDCDQLVLNNEFEIWKAALHWADEKCRQNAIEYSAENRRAALGPALLKIRFPLIPSDAFVKQIVPSGVLTVEEMFGIYQFHCHPNFRGVPGLYPLKFPIQTRIPDWNISTGNRGTVALEIEKFSEFAREKVGSYRESEIEVSIKGLLWKCWAEIRMKQKSTEKCLALFLWCIASQKEEWSCIPSATYRIVSQKIGTKNLIGKLNDHVFNNERTDFGFENIITCAELMDSSKGFYDNNEDKVILAIDFTVEEEKMEQFDLNPNKSNGTIEMEIDKFSEFAEEILLSDRVSETVFVKEIPWKMSAQIIEEESNEKSLVFFLECSPQKDSNLSCECSATVRIVSQKNGKYCLMQRRKRTVFSAKTEYQGFHSFITFAKLMDPSKGMYDKDKDKVTLAIDLTVEEKKGTKRKLADE
ncbi:hypothetical protein niasHT_028454 [Heterodera trifolii]|uniref:BTB domain-containing protein n=1 Tax=Heterodera trifolii TaxID=157864 RepID=A0ABD2KQD8_9BILA